MAYKAKLNRSEPYGEVCGNPPVPCAKYVQDGEYFNVRGERVGCDSVSPKTPEEAPAPPAAEPPSSLGDGKQQATSGDKTNEQLWAMSYDALLKLAKKRAIPTGRKPKAEVIKMILEA